MNDARDGFSIFFEGFYKNMPKIFFSNIGYARGIDGSLPEIIRRFRRLIYCYTHEQIDLLNQLKNIIACHNPDLCCLVEIDSEGMMMAKLNQLYEIVDENYPHYDIANKYGEETMAHKLPFLKGKSNAFMARSAYPFERLYFKCGMKRLIYKVDMSDNVAVIFTHFALSYKKRQMQLHEMADYIAKQNKQVILLADFNVLRGFQELKTFLAKTGLVLLNNEDEHTFLFHKNSLALDLCLCSPALEKAINLQIIDQPFSDHQGLLVNWNED
jgi:endonuclease/exonuclease/phosphatase family metal-dependent hydrolase